MFAKESYLLLTQAVLATLGHGLIATVLVSAGASVMGSTTGSLLESKKKDALWGSPFSFSITVCLTGGVSQEDNGRRHGIGVD